MTKTVLMYLELVCGKILENIWKCVLEKVSNAVSRAKWAILVGAENRMLIGKLTVKTAHKVSDGNKDSVGNWTGGHLCYIVAKNLLTFCLVS
jgi:hypothetical protein